MAYVSVDVRRHEGRNRRVVRSETHPERTLERIGRLERLVYARVEDGRHGLACGVSPQPRGGITDLLDENGIEDSRLQGYGGGFNENAAVVDGGVFAIEARSKERASASL